MDPNAIERPWDDTYCFKLSCRQCGGKCLHVTGGQHTSFDAQAVTRCTDCHRQWVVRVELLAADTSHRGHARSPEKLAGAAKARAAKSWHRA